MDRKTTVAKRTFKISFLKLKRNSLNYFQKKKSPCGRKSDAIPPQPNQINRAVLKPPWISLPRKITYVVHTQFYAQYASQNLNVLRIFMNEIYRVCA